MMAKEAVDYGIIDKMIQTKTGHITKPPCLSSRGGGGPGRWGGIGRTILRETPTRASSPCVHESWGDGGDCICEFAPSPLRFPGGVGEQGGWRAARIPGIIPPFGTKEEIG
jgi:hypothetical protein